MARNCAVFTVAMKKTPEPYRVRRVANILNKHTILWIVFNLLTTQKWVVFVFQKSGEKKTMKKYFITCVLVGCVGTAGAATVKCIYFNSNTACTYENPYDNATFNATCGGINVKGIGYCSQQSGSSMGSTSMDLTKTPGIYCWCKMLSPAVSYWVYLESAMSEDQCWHTCSIDCAIRLGDSTSEYRRSMFLNIDK